ncbi:YopX family protein [Paenibacillus sp. 1-18]|uniref:YopX family protein n=1 Tax=Paenibacillus sp. 1-18 TaxID=1333846 RepID=UPI0004710B83|nr:YopX family protein [Paenibacillus sp. 1-18]
MSRPYRVWDTESKSFWQDINKGHVGCIGQLFLKPSGDFALRQNGIIIHGSVFPGRFIRQDSTGLKDRNGKEIYEGDILAWQDHKHLWSTSDDSYTVKAIVKFNHDEFKYMVGHLSLSAKREFEVIGNIYETPLEDTP